ncbi:pyrroline-5-carboxylate reductase [Parafrigoribacterium mesophilum]|uniref:pyrroline-5-carboxylate reductase n=1 Tax=Parafrigoribacterium mesophilum TaxID=433646 RepID=UPI0031FC43D2
MDTLPAVAILGAGSMGGAILNGLVQPGSPVSGPVRVTNRTEAKAAALRSDEVISYSTEADPNANLAAITGARIVVVAVKPPMVPDLLRAISTALEPDAVVISVAAGVTIATMEALLPPSVAVLRAMPNTPALVGRGVTGLAAGSRASASDLAMAHALFATVGAVLEVPESKIDEVSAISGSGPAYVFYLIEQLTQTAVGLGFTPEQASLMVERTFLGASELLSASGETPQELRRRVTSPHGTTERAIAEMAKADLGSMFDRMATSAIARAQEIAAGA